MSGQNKTTLIVRYAMELVSNEARIPKVVCDGLVKPLIT